MPPILAILYRFLERAGAIDKLTGRDSALDGLKRLKSTSGYPKIFIYNEDQDTRIFRAIEKRISRNTEQPDLISALKDGFKPNLIVVVGSAIEIESVPPDWPQEERFSYLSNQTIIYKLHVAEPETGQVAVKACTLRNVHEITS